MWGNMLGHFGIFRQEAAVSRQNKGVYGEIPGSAGFFPGGPAAVLLCFAVLAASPIASASRRQTLWQSTPGGRPRQTVRHPGTSTGLRARLPVERERRLNWQVLPDGVIYRSYLAAPKEPRFASQWLEDRRFGSLWDITLGFRKAILRRGTEEPDRPQGFEVDFEGAAFPRLLPGQSYDLMAPSIGSASRSLPASRITNED